MFRLSTALLKLFGKIALAAYFLLAILLLGAKYWALPHIDQFRPQIANQLSAAMDVDVKLGPIRADWTGLNPKFQLTNVELTGAEQETLLSLPEIVAVLSWRSIFLLTPHFVSIDARGINLDLRRDPDGRLELLGQSFDLGADDDANEATPGSILSWLSRQNHIVLREASLRWTDELRGAPPLVLTGVTLNIANGLRDHRFSLGATPPAELGAALDIRGVYKPGRLPLGEPFGPGGGAGQLYAHVEDMHSRGWAPWLDLPQDLKSGRVSARGWLSFDAGKIRHFTSDISVAHGRWNFEQKLGAKAEFLRLFTAGPWEAFQGLLPAPAGATVGKPASTPAIEYSVVARQMEVRAAEFFEHPLYFDQIDVQGLIQTRAATGLRVQAQRLALVNKDMDANLQGTWEEGGAGPAGIVDVQGSVKRATIAAIDEYLPTAVSLEAREWMAHGLAAGKITDASLVLKGDLEHFPFAEEPTKGEFKVEGKYTGGIIDYLPPEKNGLGWPKLTDMVGSVVLERADLRLTADQALMAAAPGMPIQLLNVRAHIPDIEQDSVLSIQGDTRANAKAYLALMTHSPLGGMLDKVFNQATSDGDWEVPLSLTIPLLESSDTTVKGSLRFAGNNVRLMPETPSFSKVTGVLDFTETGASASGLKAQLLGGPVTLSGGIGGNSKGLKVQGRAAAEALARYVDLPGMKRLDGNLPYTAVLQREEGMSFGLTASSDLKGLALNFPPPLGKRHEAVLPLSVEWQGLGKGNGRALHIEMGRDIEARLMHREDGKSGPLFHAGAIGVGRKAEPPSAGMKLDIQVPKINVDEWNVIVNEFSPAGEGAKIAAPTIFPELSQLRVKADLASIRGLPLDKLAFDAVQRQPGEWRLTVDSSQTAGTLFWRESRGKIAGRVEANFDRLALGRDKTQDKQADTEDIVEDMQFDDDLDIPGINLHVKNLRLYGREVGALSVVGVNHERGRLWRLDQLTLTSPSAVLSGSGMWRLSGPKRGLALDATANIKDLGAYFDQIGHKDLMKGGEGTVQGKLEWHNMPWEFSKADLNGNVEFKLEKGRFNSLNSNSARLLELLSLQSVKRLARLDFNPGGLTKEGFPYDNLRGSLALKSGILHTSDYRVTGPVATIVIGGDVNLINDMLNLQAVVIPNLDVSGAAIAAGIAVNPILGVGAFLTQWLLQAPLAKAMTVEYRITGNWDDPQIKEAGASAAGKARNRPENTVTP